MGTKKAFGFIIIVSILSFFSFLYAQEKVQLKPDLKRQISETVSPGKMQPAKTSVELPDLIVDGLWEDDQCHINFSLRNSSQGDIPDGEHRESLVRVQVGSEIKDFPLGRVDPRGILKRAGGSISFNTQILLKSSADVKVIADFNRRIRERDRMAKGNNEKGLRMRPLCFSKAKGQKKQKEKTEPEPAAIPIQLP